MTAAGAAAGQGGGASAGAGLGAGSAAGAERAVATYRTWVQQQVDTSLPVLEAFVAAVGSGDVAEAKSLFARSRIGWEAVEPVAEAFGDLDPQMDVRENDVEAGQPWTGWHRIEKQLWVDGNTVGMAPVAGRLLDDYRLLVRRIPTAELTVAGIGNGAKELLDEVATGKITGEEDRYSHTDLVDFAANVLGAKKAFEVLRPLVQDNDPTLVTLIDRSFAELDAALAEHGSGHTFTPYHRLGRAQVGVLAARVDAVAEPLSRLAAAAVA